MKMKQLLDILVLDDERQVADMTAEVLALYFPGAAIRVAYSGEDAVQSARVRRPTVAIFDLSMAGLGGAGAARVLRSEWPETAPLLIALSGAAERLAELKHDGPFDHLLSKPVDIAALVKLLGGDV
jgi:CheY-like chemotaxis protein